MEKVALGEDNGVDSKEFGCPKSLIFCFAVERMFKESSPEIIDVVEMDQNLTSDHIFKEMTKANDRETSKFRFISWILGVFGWFLVFSPILTLLSHIPLVG